MNRNCIIFYDERRQIALPGNHDEAIAFSVKEFIRIANEAIKDRGCFFVALSGGSTPKKIFESLTSPDYIDAIDWQKVYLFWGDERSVGPDHPDSNYKMAMDSGFSRLNLNPNHVFRMKAEDSIQEHAKEYERLIKATLTHHHFDLIMLGMGDDGHTASLFPNTQALRESARLVVANEVPQKKCWRMTFTYPLINQAHHTYLYVMGEEKKHRVVEVLSDDSNTYPASKIGTQLHPALWILDEKASQELRSRL